MSGVHSRRTVAARSGLAKISRPHSADTGNRQAIAVAPGTLGMLPRSQTAPQTQSSSADTPPSPHTTYWGHLSQAHTHHREFLEPVRKRRMKSEIGPKFLRQVSHF